MRLFITALGSSLCLWLACAQNVGAQVDSSAVYYLVNEHSGSVLQASGSKLTQGKRVDGTHQQFRFEDKGSGYYVMLNVKTRTVLDVPASSRVIGRGIILYGKHGGPNQQFKVEPAGGETYRIINRNNGLCLSIPAGVPTEGAQIVQQKVDRSPQQIWRLESVGSTSERVVSEETTPLPWEVFSDHLGVFVAETGPNGGPEKTQKNFDQALERYKDKSNHALFGILRGQREVISVDFESRLRKPVGLWTPREGSFVEMLPDGAELAEIRVWAGAVPEANAKKDSWIHGIQMVVRNPDRPLAMHGTASGDRHVFVLEEGESLRAIRASARQSKSAYIAMIQFETDRGRKSPVYGDPTDDEGTGRSPLQSTLEGDQVFSGLAGSVGHVGTDSDALTAIGVTGGDIKDTLTFRSNQKPYVRQFELVAPDEYKEITSTERRQAYEFVKGEDDSESLEEKRKSTQQKRVWKEVRRLGRTLKFLPVTDDGRIRFNWLGCIFVSADENVRGKLPSTITSDPDNVEFLLRSIDQSEFLPLQPERSKLAEGRRKPVFAKNLTDDGLLGWSLLDYADRRIFLDPIVAASGKRLAEAAGRGASRSHHSSEFVGSVNPLLRSRVEALYSEEKVVFTGEAMTSYATVALDPKSVDLDPTFQARAEELGVICAAGNQAAIRSKLQQFRSDYGTHYVHSITFGVRESYYVRRPVGDGDAAGWKSRIAGGIKQKPFEEWTSIGGGEWQTWRIGSATKWAPIYFQLAPLNDLFMVPFTNRESKAMGAYSPIVAYNDELERKGSVYSTRDILAEELAAKAAVAAKRAEEAKRCYAKITVYCFKPSESEDELYLIVEADGKKTRLPTEHGYFMMVKGDEVELGLQKYPYKSSCTVSLMEDDDSGSDDLIGKVDLPTTESHGSERLYGDSSNYVVRYHVVRW